MAPKQAKPQEHLARIRFFPSNFWPAKTLVYLLKNKEYKLDFFQEMNILEFIDKFKDEDSCKAYLAEYKWKDGFSCPRCGCTEHHQSRDPYLRRCKKCYHSESVTAGTIFHKVKFPLRKAFTMVYMISTTNKGLSSNQFAKTLQINKDTAWLFSQKIKQAMQSQSIVVNESEKH